MFKYLKNDFPASLVVFFVALPLCLGIALASGAPLFSVMIAGITVPINSYQNSHFSHIVEQDTDRHIVKMEFAEEVTFFNKGTIMRELEEIPKETYLEIDVLKTRYLDNDIIEVLEDFLIKAQNRNIHIKLLSKQGTVESPKSFIKFLKVNYH